MGGGPRRSCCTRSRIGSPRVRRRRASTTSAGCAAEGVWQLTFYGRTGWSDALLHAHDARAARRAAVAVRTMRIPTGLLTASSCSPTPSAGSGSRTVTSWRPCRIEETRSPSPARSTTGRSSRARGATCRLRRRRRARRLRRRRAGRHRRGRTRVRRPARPRGMPSSSTTSTTSRWRWPRSPSGTAAPTTAGRPPSSDRQSELPS